MHDRGLRRAMAVFACAFLLCGALRVLTYHRDLCEGFSQWFCGVLLLLWAVTVRSRVTDRRLRRLILGTAASLLLFLILQLFRGCLTFGKPVLQRYFWYSYYIPYIATPLLLFLCALAAYRPGEQPLPRRAWCAAAAIAALALCALTNDLHQWMFRFPGGVFRDTEEFSPGPVFWLYFFCYGALLLAGFIITLRKAWRIRRALSFLIPLIPLLLLAVWMFQNLRHAAPAVGGVKLWVQSDCFCFAFTAYLELCIQIGLIPANTGYGSLFSALKLSAAILDTAGRPVRRSAGEQYPFPVREDLLVRTQPIGGGSVAWAVDLRRVLSLNEQLEEAARQTEHRNAYLREKGRMKKELTELETRNRLYAQVSRAVQARQEEIGRLSETDFRRNLPRICVLTAYVKRRCNMELLTAEGSLCLEELTAALTESLDAVRLCGVETALTASGSGELPAALVISAYEHVLAVVLEGLDTMRAVLLRASGADGDDPFIEIRMLLKTDNLSWDFERPFPGAGGVRPQVRVSMDEGDLSVALRFTEGGSSC